MNDRYLYRAKRTDNREWVEGYYVLIDNCHYIYTGNLYNGGLYVVAERFEIDIDTLCACTGLKDKNGKMIWENDVVEAWSQGRCAIGKIKHRIDGTWIMYPAWQNGEMWYLLPNDDGITTVEVIGNIFDNQELMHE